MTDTTWNEALFSELGGFSLRLFRWMDVGPIRSCSGLTVDDYTRGDIRQHESGNLMLRSYVDERGRERFGFIEGSPFLYGAGPYLRFELGPRVHSDGVCWTREPIDSTPGGLAAWAVRL